MALNRTSALLLICGAVCTRIPFSANKLQMCPQLYRRNVSKPLLWVLHGTSTAISVRGTSALNTGFL